MLKPDKVIQEFVEENGLILERENYEGNGCLHDLPDLEEGDQFVAFFQIEPKIYTVSSIDLGRVYPEGNTPSFKRHNC